MPESPRRALISSFETTRQDARLAVRLMRRAPAFSAIVVLTLALGIGANTAIFGVVNSLLLRPLPVADPDRLVTVSSDFAISRGFNAGFGWNLPMWERLQPHVTQFDGAIAWAPARFDLAQGGEKQPADGLFTSGTYFATLGLHAWRGRLLTTADDRPGGGAEGPIAVISHSFWQRRFDGSDSAVGARLMVDGVPVTIAGVTPPAFSGLEVGRGFDVALPLLTEPLIHRDRSWLQQYALAVMLRLKPDQSPEMGTTVLRSLQTQIVGVTPERPTPDRLKDPFTLVPAGAGTSGASRIMTGLRQSYQAPLLTIFVVVLFVLLIACVNIANLLLARAASRHYELSVRLALGASPARLARQLLIESLIFAGLGATLGLIFAAWGSRIIISQLSTPLDHIALAVWFDWRVLGFTAAVAVTTAAIVGIAPALGAARIAPMDALKAQGRSASAGESSTVGRSRLSSGLVVVQVAMSLALVVAAGLLLRTFERLTHVPLGFDRDRVALVNVDTTRAVVDPKNRLPLFDRVVDAVRDVPGVAHAGGSIWAPIDGGMRMADPRRHVAFNFVTPDWFAAYGTTIRLGRDFTSQDTVDAAPVAIVNDAYVRALLPGRVPLGEAIPYARSPHGNAQRTIVGVVEDTVFDSQREGTQPIVYMPIAQSAPMAPAGHAEISIGVRATAGSPLQLTRRMSDAIVAIDSNLALTVRPLSDQVSASIARERLLAMLSGFFGALALVLAALGLYGVTSHAVNRRTTEIGIRMALGAQRADVIRLVLQRTLTMTGVGIVLGLAAAAGVTRYLRGMLFGLTPLDPMTFAGVAVLFVAVATLAASIPARRATKVDPLVALRCE